MMIRDMASQCRFSLFPTRLNPIYSESSSSTRISFSGHDRLQDQSRSFPHDIADHIAQFQIHILHGLLHTIHLSCLLLRQPDTIARQVT